MTSPWFANPDSLTQVENDCWKLLLHAVDDRACGWRLPALATFADNTLRQRTVVIRKVDPELKQLLVHTDVRSAKVTAIRRNPSVSWLFYDATCQVQLHLTGMATVHTNDEVATRMWDREPESSLRGYLGPLIPGSVCDQSETNLPADLQQTIPTREQLAPGRCNFAVIGCRVTTAECLILGADGNRRACFSYSQGERFAADWIVP